MGLLGAVFLKAASGALSDFGTHASPIEALVSHVSNVGNPTTAPSP